MNPGQLGLDLSRAPSLRLTIARVRDSSQCYALLHLHHLFHDHVSIRSMLGEVNAVLSGAQELLPASVPYRNHVARALARARVQDQESFFRARLADINVYLLM